MSGQTAVHPEIEKVGSTAPSSSSRLFWITLALIAIAGFAIRFYIASQNYMSWDEWEHVFIASGARPVDVHFELRIDAHPPLHIELLRQLLRFGHSKLLYRAISIVSGSISILLIGLICERVCRNRIVALLCAAAFAFSEVALEVGTEVRSYELTVLFVLAAFCFYLQMISSRRDPVPARTYVLFGLFSALAVSSHYFAGLFAGACIALLAVLLSPGVRDRGGRLMKGAAVCLLPVAVLAYFYIKHASKQPIQGYLTPFYWSRAVHESRTWFLFRNSMNFWNLFSPVPLHQDVVFGIVLAACVCIAGWAMWKTGSLDRKNRAGLIVVVFPAVMVLELMVLASMRAYPFGGMLRHQYIVAPFLILAAFVVLDRIASMLPRKAALVTLATAGACIAINAAVPRPDLVVFPGQLIYSDELARWRAAFPNARGVYLDRFGMIAYFANSDSEPRHFVRSIHDVVLIDWYHVNQPGPQGLEIFYDKVRGNLDVTDQSVYHSIASTLDQSGLGEITLFYFRSGNRDFDQRPDELKRIITNEARAEGLEPTKIVVDHFALYAGFRLRQD